MNTLFYFCDLRGPPRPGMHNSNPMTGQKIIFNSKGPKLQSFYPDQELFLSNKQAESNTFWHLRATLKASVVHIWPTGRMLCMPALDPLHGPPVKPMAYSILNKIAASDPFR